MLGINSNINSLVAQQNLTTSGSALSQAITRLSSGKRINSAADDAAGLAISNIMQTQINGLTQGVSNANNGVSMVQTASSGLSSLTSSLQTIRQLAVEASDGSMTDSDRAALQQEVSQQIQEVNRVAAQTTFNGQSILNGSLGTVSFQVGANVGQTISVDLSQNVAASALGGGLASQGSVLSTLTGLSLNSTDGSSYTGSGAATLTTINVLSDGKGGFTFTDQNNQALSSSAVQNLFGGQLANTGTGTALTLTPQGALTSGASASQTSSIKSIQAANSQLTAGGFAASGSVLNTITPTQYIKTDLSGEDGGTSSTTDIASVQILADGSGGYTFRALDSNKNDITSSVTGGEAGLAALFTTSAASGTTPGTISLSSAGATAFTEADGTTSDTSAATGAFAAAATANYTAPTYANAFQPSGKVLSSVTIAGTNLLDADLTSAESTSGTIKTVDIVADGNGGFAYKALDANGKDITSTVTGAGGTSGSAALATLFNGTASNADASTATAAQLTAGTSATNNGTGTAGFSVAADVTAAGAAVTAANLANNSLVSLGTVSVNLDQNGDPTNVAANTKYTSVNVYGDGSGGYIFKAVDSSGAVSTDASVNSEAALSFNVGSSTTGSSGKSLTGTGVLADNPNADASAAGIAAAQANNKPTLVSQVDISTAAGANLAMETIDNALATVNNLQADLGAAQNRFTSIATTQQALSTDLSQAQSQIQDANFAQETANLSKAQVLQQAGISVLAQANSQPQQILKLLQ
jgi:flagellin